MGDYRKLLNELREIEEEVTSGDIASVETKLGDKPVRRQKGKKCHDHKRFNCPECHGDHEDKWS